jgi:hypothetical protein
MDVDDEEEEDDDDDDDEARFNQLRKLKFVAIFDGSW